MVWPNVWVLSYVATVIFGLLWLGGDLDFAIFSMLLFTLNTLVEDYFLILSLLACLSITSDFISILWPSYVLPLLISTDAFFLTIMTEVVILGWISLLLSLFSQLG